MEKLTSFTERVNKLPRFLKIAGGLATLYALGKANDELNPKPVVSVIDLQGVIMSGKGRGPLSGGQQPINLETTRKNIDKAFRPKRLEYVLLNVNSPGGAPVQCDLVSSYIKAKAVKKGVPVIAFVEDYAASGGYWLACTAGEIYCGRSSVVGSIGVISDGFGFVEGMEKLGVERRVFTAGKNKRQLDPFLPVEEEDVARRKELLDRMHSHFIEHVKTSRGDRLQADDEKLFNGEFWTGDVAAELGLVDGVKLLESWVSDKYGDKVRVLRLGSGGLLAGLFGAMVPRGGVLEALLPDSGALGGCVPQLVVEAREQGLEAVVAGALK